MLVLTRKEDQSLVIGDNIRVTIGKIHGNRVRILIDAPDDVSVLRGELKSFSVPAQDRNGKVDKTESLLAS
ncbi:MAG: carbon storage regulator [Pirellulaceae bacterium]